MKKNFEFTYKAKKIVVEDLKFKEIFLPLTVTGVGYYDPKGEDPGEKYSVDIDDISGATVKQVIEFGVEIDDVIEQACRHISTIF